MRPSAASVSMLNFETVKKKAAPGTATPSIACVEGIPYSRDHLVWSWTTTGIPGLSHLMRSFRYWPMYMIRFHTNTRRRPMLASRFQNQRLKNRAQNGSSPSCVPKRKR